VGVWRSTGYTKQEGNVAPSSAMETVPAAGEARVEGSAVECGSCSASSGSRIRKWIIGGLSCNILPPFFIINFLFMFNS
jgi:hypothetical protein